MTHKSPKCQPIDFVRLGQDFYQVYFGDTPDVSITDLAKILGGQELRNWGKMFIAWVEMKKLPYVKKSGRMRITPTLIAAWLERESNWRESERMVDQ